MIHTERITLADTQTSMVVKMVEGNPGALNVIMELLEKGSLIDPKFGGGMSAILQLDSYGIYGSSIYVLHNDICSRNISQTIAVLRAVQLGFLESETLRKACSSDGQYANTIPVLELYDKVKQTIPDFDKN